MARPHSGPKYYASRGAYYVQFRGKQHFLAAGPQHDPAVYQEALRKYSEVILTDETERRTDVRDVTTILDYCVSWTKENRSESTAKNYRQIFDSFIPTYGHIRVKDLKPYHVTEWLSTRKTWGPTQKNRAVTGLVRALNLGVKQGLIEKNALAGMERPQAKSRGASTCITLDEHLAMCKASNKAFRQLLEVLWETGGRPYEVRNLRAKWYDPSLRAFVLPDDMPERKRSSKGRVIYCSDRCLEIVLPLMERNPQGAILLNHWGLPWKNVTVGQMFRRLKEKLHINKSLMAYGYRHGFCTAALRNRTSLPVLVEAMGHKDSKMIFHHYGHLAKEHDLIREEISKLSDARRA